MSKIKNYLEYAKDEQHITEVLECAEMLYNNKQPEYGMFLLRSFMDNLGDCHTKETRIKFMQMLNIATKQKPELMKTVHKYLELLID